ncbi:phage tail tip lysozyme [Tianweitania sediminis]|uniref:Phage tail length tape measure family protein n=1 Tax=Tianweitania sediminis TaxID=1502156 RepID=A0A8J7RLL2_9HYPH|nr:phage tail tip lysozyme [Tianweitania sediminis]MBP0439431.1 phage tail length tape measure family protein [Tianweitania sediminis]
MSLNLALVIGGNAEGAKRAAAETRQGLQDVANANDAVVASTNRVAAAQQVAANHVATMARNAETMAERINRSLNIGRGAAAIGSPFAMDAARGRDIDAFGRQLDSLRAKYNPLFSVIQNYKAQQAEIRQAHSVGAISVNEMTAALDRERRAALDNIAALKGRTAALRETARVSAQSTQPGGGAGFNSANISYQLQDIAVTTQMGQSPIAIALQQGTQLSAQFNDIVRSGQRIGPAIGSAFLSILNPISLVTIATIGAGAALVQYFMDTETEADKAEEALQKHLEMIEGVAQKWGDATPALQRYVEELRKGREIQDLLAATEEVAAKSYEPAREQIADILGMSAQARSDLMSANRDDAAGFRGIVEVMEELETRINKSTASTGDLDAAIKVLSETNQQFGSTGITSINDLIEALREYREEVGRASADAERYRIDAQMQFVPTYVDPKVLQNNPYQTIQEQEEFDRRYREKLEADQRMADASSRALSQSRPGSDIELGDWRAEFDERRRAEAERLKRDRERDQARQDRLSKPYESMLGSQREQLELLRAEAGMLGQSREAREAVVASLKLEQEIRQLGIPLYGEEAQALRANANEIIELTRQRTEAVREAAKAERDWAENRDIAKGFLTDSADALREGANLWEALADAAVNALQRIADKILDQAFEGLLDIIMPNPQGSKSGGGSFIPTIGGFAELIFGKSGAGANDNYAPGAVTRAPLAPIGAAAASAALAPAGGVQSQVWNYFAGKGLAPHQIAGIMGNVAQESRFNPLAVGDGGYAHGLFQWNDRRDNLFSHIGGRGNLDDVQGQLDFAWKELQTSESAAFKRLMNAGDVREATAAFGGFERPRGWSAADPENMHGWSNRLSAAEDAMARFGSKTESATSAIDTMTTGATSAGEGLGSLGKGLDEFGNNLSNAFPAAPSGGGGGGFFGKLFGGGGGGLPSFSFMNSISPLAANHIMNGGFGLFADGTESAPPGWAWVGEEGPELRKLRAGDVIRSNPRSRAMVAEHAIGLAGFGGGRGAVGGSAAATVQAVHVTVGVDVDDDGNLRAYVKNVAQQEGQAQATAAVSSFAADLPDHIQGYERNRHRRGPRG